MLKKLLLPCTLLVTGMTFTGQPQSATFEQLKQNQEIAARIGTYTDEEQSTMMRMLNRFEELHQQVMQASQQIAEEESVGMQLFAKMLEVDGFEFGYSLVPCRKPATETDKATDDCGEEMCTITTGAPEQAAQ